MWRWERNIESFLKFKGWEAWPEVAAEVSKEGWADLADEFSAWVLRPQARARDRIAARPHSFCRFAEALEAEQARLLSEEP